MLSAKGRCLRSPVASSARLAVQELHTNRRSRPFCLASSFASNSTVSPADARNRTSSRFTTTTWAVASCAIRQAASSGAVTVSTSPVTVTTRTSELCSATRRSTRSTGKALFISARYSDKSPAGTTQPGPASLSGAISSMSGNTDDQKHQKSQRSSWASQPGACAADAYEAARLGFNRPLGIVNVSEGACRGCPSVRGFSGGGPPPESCHAVGTRVNRQSGSESSPRRCCDCAGGEQVTRTGQPEGHVSPRPQLVQDAVVPGVGLTAGEDPVVVQAE